MLRVSLNVLVLYPRKVRVFGNTRSVAPLTGPRDVVTTREHSAKPNKVAAIAMMFAETTVCVLFSQVQIGILYALYGFSIFNSGATQKSPI